MTVRDVLRRFFKGLTFMSFALFVAFAFAWIIENHQIIGFIFIGLLMTLIIYALGTTLDESYISWC